MSKVGKVFKNLFKVIFICAALFFGLISLCCMVAPFLASSAELLGVTTVVSVSGFALAFGGDVTTTISKGDNVSSAVTGHIDLNAGILSAFIILCVALVLALIFLVCAWGKKASTIKKFFAFGSAICFLTCGILFFCTKNLIGEGNLLSGLEINMGAISCGVLAVIASICSLVAGALGPSNN